MGERPDDLRAALGSATPPAVDREAVFAGVQRRLHSHRQNVAVAKILAVGAVALSAAIGLSGGGADPSHAPVIARQEPSRAPALQDEWLAVSQAPGTSMTTSQTERGVRIDLRAGGVAAEVRPGSQRRLEVETPHAEVRVTGTTVAILVDGLRTQIGVGEGSVVLVVQGVSRTLRAGEAVVVEGDDVQGRDLGAVGDLLATLPGKWHDRYVPARPTPVVQSPAAGAQQAATSFAGRGCDAAVDAARTAEDGHAPRTIRKSALELLTRCAPAERIRWLEALVALAPDHPVAWLDLGRARERGGDRTGAALAYGRHLQVAGAGPLADEGALALCRVSWDRRNCLQRFLRERPDSDRRQEAEEQFRALER